MKCPYCEKELIQGKIKLYATGSLLVEHYATIKFVFDDDSRKTLKGDQFYTEPEGYYCDDCKKIVACFNINNSIWTL